VFDASRNTPTVASRCLVLLGANRKPEATPDQVAGLLVGVGVPGEDRTFAQQEFRHQGSVAVNQRLALNPVQSRAVTSIASFAEHGAD